jgi:FdhD protein
MAKVKNVQTKKFSSGEIVLETDLVVIEEPLEIRLEYGEGAFRREVPVSLTMRTPDNDAELSAGFLFTEGIVRKLDDFLSIEHCRNTKPEAQGNVIRVRLREGAEFNESVLKRNFYLNSSCGICGKASLENLEMICPVKGINPLEVSPEILLSLNEKVRAEQSVFRYTGGLHAAAIFDISGNLLLLREDVGRHNALDKVIGNFLLQDSIPLDSHILFLSGRVSFEMMQKAAFAGIRLVCAVGAPTSLAVEAAHNLGITLIGFLRENRFNVY